MQLVGPIYLAPLLSTTVDLLPLLVALAIATAALLAIRHRNHGVWRHR